MTLSTPSLDENYLPKRWVYYGIINEFVVEFVGDSSFSTDDFSAWESTGLMFEEVRKTKNCRDHCETSGSQKTISSSYLIHYIEVFQDTAQHGSF